MEEENNSTVNTINDQNEKNKQRNAEKKENQENKSSNVISFIIKHFSIIWKVVLVIFAILFIVGILQILITMPGLVLGKIKEFSSKILSTVSGWITGDNISARISKEDEIEIAQYIQDMGYDIVGYGFGDAKYKENEQNEGKGIQTSQIADISKGEEQYGVRDYLKAYMVQNEATYALSEWNLLGSFISMIEGGTAEDYSKGMINISVDRSQSRDHSMPQIEINRDSKMLRVRMGTSTNALSYSYYYFNMADWVARYGKPLELFLSLHLSTMMPDLAYDLATAQCFNTKINIDMQPVQAKYTVSYTNGNETATRQDIERERLRLKWGITTGYTGDNFERFYEYVINYSKNGRNRSRGIDLTYIEMQMRGETPKEEQDDWYEVEVPVEDDGQSESQGNEQTGDNTTNQTRTERRYNEHSFAGEIPVSLWRPSGIFSNLAGNQFEELTKLMEEGKNNQTLYWPRITDVTNHWYYNKIEFTYGRAGYATKTIQYEPEDTHNPLYGVEGIVLNTTMTAENGVYYQLCNPEAEGPNDAIKALFKGGKGTLNGTQYNFPGKYYRYDGSRIKAREIANARATDYKQLSGNTRLEMIGGELVSIDTSNEPAIYKYEGSLYTGKKVTVEKEPVTFYDTNNQNSYKNAFAAFAILEKAKTEEAEAAYRNLKELLIELDYFTEDELRDPMTQVLDWFMPDNLDENNLYKDANKYGIILKNSLGRTITAPGNAKVISINKDTLTIQFSTLDQGMLEKLKEKYKDELYYIDEKEIVDVQMVITGISTNVTEGQEIRVGDIIGTASSNEVQVYMKRDDGSIIDNIEKYMAQTMPIAKDRDDFGTGKTVIE